MAPKRKLSASCDSEVGKRARKVLSLQSKVELLDRLANGESVASVGRSFEINESTVRTIKQNEVKIRASVSAGGTPGAKSVHTTRDHVLEKMEKALNIWIEDQTQKRAPLSTALIRTKALNLYQYMQQDSDAEEASKATPFSASRGWFDRFRKRACLHNVKLAGEAASADTDGAEKYKAVFKEMIEEKGYKPEQVFNADETGLFWKKMPQRTYISQEEKVAPGFKAAKDRLTLMMCANASGDFVVKPMMLYRSLNPRALAGKNKQHLPVFWRSNKKAWVTADVFMDWFNNCFVHEVEKYLVSKNLAFKVLLLLDNAPGHPSQRLQFAHPNVEVQFLPPNTTSLIQPMDQGVIATFKAYYTRRTFSRLFNAMELNESLTIINAWKKYDIAACIENVHESVEEMKVTTLNGCWKNLWPECVNNFVRFSLTDEVKRIVAVANTVPGIGDVVVEDVRDLLESHVEELTEEELDTLAKCSSDEEEGNDKREEVIKPKLTLKSVNRIFTAAAVLSETIDQLDPFMSRSLNCKRQIEDLIAPYKEIKKDLLNKARQTSITQFLAPTPQKEKYSQQKVSATPSTSSAQKPLTSFFKPQASSRSVADVSAAAEEDFFRDDSEEDSFPGFPETM
jgi:hypothetical protein